MDSNYQLMLSWLPLIQADFSFKVGLTYEPKISKNTTGRDLSAGAGGGYEVVPKGYINYKLRTKQTCASLLFSSFLQ
jgi:hypothetical protein